jgi:VCBS repeat-containing protein
MGSPAPTIAGTLTGAVTEGSGAILTGSLFDSTSGSGDDTWSISAGPSYGTATINPATGTWSYDLNDNHPALWALGAGQTLTDLFTVRINDTSGGAATAQVRITITGIPCFLRGTLILTERGPRAVEDLHPGDMILTADHGPQPLRWIGLRRVSAEEMELNPQLCPIRLRAGSLGPGLPARDLKLSPQHRVVVRGNRGEVLVPVQKLLSLPGIARAPGTRRVAYYHLLFDRHEVIFAEGAATESLLLTPRALDGWPARAVEEIRALFPQAFRPAWQMPPARPIIERASEVAALLAQAPDRALRPDDDPEGAVRSALRSAHGRAA